jgi:hypothetical protein
MTKIERRLLQGPTPWSNRAWRRTAQAMGGDLRVSTQQIAAAYAAIIPSGRGTGPRRGNCFPAVRGLASEHEAEAVFGVFAAPVQECLHRTANDAVVAGEWGRVLTCYAAWNVQRSVDGGKPTFEHRRFCCVGALSDAALRWVR